MWGSALNVEGEKGSQITETTIEVGRIKKERRVLRVIVRPSTHHRRAASLDDLDGWPFHAIVTNLPTVLAPAEQTEAHQRLRAGINEDAIRQLNEDYGLIHGPAQNCFGELRQSHPPSRPITPRPLAAISAFEQAATRSRTVPPAD